MQIGAENLSKSRSPRASRAVLTTLLLMIVCLARANAGSPLVQDTAVPIEKNCHGVHLVNIVGHMDDDLLFIEPGISQVLNAGGCVTSIFLNGGGTGLEAGFDFVLKRENASKKAYAAMLGRPTEWTPAIINTGPARVMSVTANAQPGLKLIFLRVPGGGGRGGDVPLANLLDLDTVVKSWPFVDYAEGPINLYSRSSLIELLTGLIVSEGATKVYALNPDTVPYEEHPDHIYSARLTRLAVQKLTADIPVTYHETYSSAGLPPNVDPSSLQAKRHVVARYFHFEMAEPVQFVFSEAFWNGNWIGRHNFDLSHSHERVPTVNIPWRPLVNFQTQQCLVSNGLGRRVSLAKCESNTDQGWAFVPSSVPVGGKGVALLKTASGHCIGREGDQLIERVCESNASSQQWTPWDFGKVFVPGPGRKCLDAGQPALIANCDMFAGSALWVRSVDNIDSNESMEVALTGDVIGNGSDRTVQVQRRPDGPGVDVWVTSMDADKVTSEKWYEGRVPFDPASLSSGCDTALCYDSTRYLLADFDGDRRADLMAISAGKGDETIFRLLKNEGGHFAAPVIWRTLETGHAYGQAQQYLTGDFRGVGKQDVLIVQTCDKALSAFWLMTNTGSSLEVPVLWGDARKSPLSTRFFNIRLDPDGKDDVLAVHSSGEGLNLYTYKSSGSFLAFDKSFEYPGFLRARVVVMSSAVTKLTDIWILHATANDAATFFWKISNLDKGEFAAIPSLVFVAPQLKWADVRPYGSATGRQLLLPYRVDDPVAEYHWRVGRVGFMALNLSEAGSAVGLKDHGHSPQFEWANLLWRARLN